MYVIQSVMGNWDNSVRGPCSGSLQSATRKRSRTRQENAMVTMNRTADLARSREGLAGPEHRGGGYYDT